MTLSDIVRFRLCHQQLVDTNLTTPGDVVSWLGAVQAQEYPAAKWAVALRTAASTAADLDRLLADGTILRTHVLRPTWHFVMPVDIRWMLALTAPRINAHMAYAYRQVELDDAHFVRSNAALAKALHGDKRLTRAELLAVLQQAGVIGAHEGRLNYLLIRAELDAVICSGGLRGKQQTYALLDERAPATAPLARDEALAELTRRYFSSHGPATVKDYVWWSGLTVTDAKAGLDMVKSNLVHADLDGQTYWFANAISPVRPSPTAHLLPSYDEYVVAYTDRAAIFDTSHTTKLDSRANPLFNYVMLLDGQLVGTWQRAFKKDTVVVTLSPFTALGDAETCAFMSAAQRYGEFLNMSTELLFSS